MGFKVKQTELYANRQILSLPLRSAQDILHPVDRALKALIRNDYFQELVANQGLSLQGRIEVYRDDSAIYIAINGVTIQVPEARTEKREKLRNLALTVLIAANEKYQEAITPREDPPPMPGSIHIIHPAPPSTDFARAAQETLNRVMDQYRTLEAEQKRALLASDQKLQGIASSIHAFQAELQQKNKEIDRLKLENEALPNLHIALQQQFQKETELRQKNHELEKQINELKAKPKKSRKSDAALRKLQLKYEDNKEALALLAKTNQLIVDGFNRLQPLHEKYLQTLNQLLEASASQETKTKALQKELREIKGILSRLLGDLAENTHIKAENSLLATEIMKLKKDLLGALAEKEEIALELANTKGNLASLEKKQAEIEKLTQEKGDLEEALSMARQNHEQSTLTLQREIEDLGKKHQETLLELEKLSQAKTNLEKELAPLKDKLVQAVQKSADLSSEFYEKEQELQKTIKNQDSKIADLTKEKTDLERQLKEKEKLLQASHEENKQKQALIDRLQKELSHLHGEKGKLNQAKSELEQELQSLKAKLEQIAHTNADLTAHTNAAQEELKRKEGIIAGLEQKLLDAQNLATRERFAHTKAVQEHEKLQKALQEKEENIRGLEEKLRQGNGDNTSLQGELTKERLAKDTLEKQLDQLQKTLSQEKAEKEELTTRLKQVIQTCANLSDRAVTAEEELKKIQSRVADLEQELGKAKTNAEKLKGSLAAALQDQENLQKTVHQKGEENRRLTALLVDKESTILRLQTALTEQKNKGALLEEKLGQVESLNEDLLAQIEKLQKDILAKDQELSLSKLQAAADIKKFQKTIEKQKKELAEKDGNLRAKEMEIDTLTELVDGKNAELLALNHTLHDLQTKNTTLQDELNTVQEKLSALEKENSDQVTLYRNLVQDLEAQKAFLEAKINDLEKAKEAHELEKTSLEKELEKTRKANRKLKDKLRINTERINTLESEKNNVEKIALAAARINKKQELSLAELANKVKTLEAENISLLGRVTELDAITTSQKVDIENLEQAQGMSRADAAKLASIRKDLQKLTHELQRNNQIHDRFWEIVSKHNKAALAHIEPMYHLLHADFKLKGEIRIPKLEGGYTRLKNADSSTLFRVLPHPKIQVVDPKLKQPARNLTSMTFHISHPMGGIDVTLDAKNPKDSADLLLARHAIELTLQNKGQNVEAFLRSGEALIQKEIQNTFESLRTAKDTKKEIENLSKEFRALEGDKNEETYLAKWNLGALKTLEDLKGIFEASGALEEQKKKQAELHQLEKALKDIDANGNTGLRAEIEEKKKDLQRGEKTIEALFDLFIAKKTSIQNIMAMIYFIQAMPGTKNKAYEPILDVLLDAHKMLVTIFDELYRRKKESEKNNT